MATPQQLTPVNWPFPIYGVNTELNARNLPPEALVSCANMYYVQPYLLRSRGGIDSTYSGSGDVTHIYYWDYDSALYFADDAKHLYRNGTLKATGAQNVTDIVSFGVGAIPTLYVCENETANPSIHTWNGTTYAALTGTDVPRARKLMPRFGRLFATDSAEYPYRVFFSDVGDATVWSGAFGEGGYFDVCPGDGGAFRDWIDYEGILYILRDHGIYRVVGDTPGTFAGNKVTQIDGALANSLSDCGKGLLYTTKYGVFPVGAPRAAEAYDVTRNIGGTFQSFVSGGNISACYSPELNAYVVVNGTTTAWVSNLSNRPDVWTSFTLPTAMCAVHQGNGLWFGGVNGSVYLYDHDDFKDGASTAIACSFKTGDWNFGNERPAKTIRWVEGYLNATQTATATVALYADGAAAATSAQTMHTATLTTGKRPLVEYNFKCKSVALGITYTAMTAPVAFAGAVLQVVRGDPLD